MDMMRAVDLKEKNQAIKLRKKETHRKGKKESNTQERQERKKKARKSRSKNHD